MKAFPQGSNWPSKAKFFSCRTFPFPIPHSPLPLIPRGGPEFPSP
ncbi:hypothetical protein FDUTEX481_03613 [Tolypothrix sp. PCC 7601]|nr:hypothetical protein FDUTEX481_03613 [Tolypothrix sp. PCC 7601]